MKTKRLYKVLTKDLRGPFRNEFQYHPNKWYHCEDFDPDPRNDCSNGFYATDLEGVTYSYRPHKDRRVYLVEVKGQSVEIDPYKRRYEYIKLIRRVGEEELKGLLKAWKGSYDLYHAVYPIDPSTMDRTDVTPHEIQLLEDWSKIRSSVGDSVGYSVGDSVMSSVGDSVWSSVWDSVGYSVRYSVRSSVRDSVGDSVWSSVRSSVRDSVYDIFYAYLSSLFPGIQKWKGIDHKEEVNPVQAGIDLWKSGLVPSFDGETWRIHGGNKMDPLYTR